MRCMGWIEERFMDIKRVNWLDYARGGAVILVILHHCGNLKKYILSFHMPLFFFITGMVKRYKMEPTEQYGIYMRKRFFRLIVPYYSFEVMCLVTAITVKAVFQYMNFEDVYHIELLYAFRDALFVVNSEHYIGVCNRFWFLPCAFISEAMFYWVEQTISSKHFEKKSESFCWFIIFLIFVGLSKLENILLPSQSWLTLDISLMAMAFLSLGRCAYYIFDIFLNEKKKLYFTGISALIISLIINFFNKDYFLMFINEYGNYFLAIIGATAGIVFYLSVIISCRAWLPRKILSYFSEHSLVIFPLHLIILAGLNKICDYLPYLGDLKRMKACFMFGIVLILLVPLIFIIDRWFPWLNGKRRKAISVARLE